LIKLEVGTNEAIKEQRGAWIAWAPLAILPATVLAFAKMLAPWVFMWSLSFAIFAGLKWLTFWSASSRVPHSTWRGVAYLLGWPGMDAEAFLTMQRLAPRPQAREWNWAILKTLLGVVLIWVIARRIPHYPLARGWIGLFGLIFLLHFGSFHLVALFWQSLGILAQPIMSNPARAASLSEFWGKRWNLGFRQLSFELIFKPLHRPLGAATASLLVFVASGLIHDLVISVPARGGYGLPTAYFLLQGCGVTLQRSNLGERLGLNGGLAGRIFMFVMTAGPAFWLFHPPFLLRVVLPFMKAIHAL
jgi:hypothetical protein